MYLNGNTVQFQGFNPSEFVRSYVESRLDSIQDEAPHGANIKAVFTRRGKLLKGVLTISSSAGKFFAVATGDKIKDVNKRLTEQIRKQLDRWKSKRFQHETIRGVQIEEDVAIGGEGTSVENATQGAQNEGTGRLA